jgi:uncharacterized protein (DUF488 family)
MILTVGHSILPIEDFLALLREHGVVQLADVRTIPKSRRNPQFESDALKGALQKQGIRYEHMPALGGLRHPRKDSTNFGWKNPGFRGYADYMQTEEFQNGLKKLIDISTGGLTAIMCAEAVPWRCHRSLIADALLAQGIPVEHIQSLTKTRAHTMTPFARVDGKRVTYPGLDLGA